MDPEAVIFRIELVDLGEMEFRRLWYIIIQTQISLNFLHIDLAKTW